MKPTAVQVTHAEILTLASARFNQGDMVGVLDLIDTLTEQHQADPMVRRLKARTLSQSGQPHEARRIINELLNQAEPAGGLARSDLTALIGRTWKDEWQHHTGASNHGRLLESVIENYRQAFNIAQSTDDSFHDLYYAAINVATFSHIAGRRSEAVEYAKMVLTLCGNAENLLTGSAPNAWPLGSRAEAHALLGHTEEAIRDFQAMTSSGLLGLRDLCSARKQARLVAQYTGQDHKIFDTAFNLPSIVVFAGHRLDDPQRRSRRGPRLPLEVLGSLRLELDRLLASLDARISYSSAASGADIVFLEAMQEGNLETHILLSSPEESFRRTNIDNVAAHGGGWTERFNAVLAKARSEANGGSVMAASPHEPSEDSIAYVYASLIMSGQALHRARNLDLDLYPVAVWDELPGDGPGGTAEFCQAWEQRGISPKIINPTRLPRPNAIELATPVPAPVNLPRTKITAFRQEIKSILFADVKNFSKLSEDQVELFSRYYLGRVSEIISQPISRQLNPPIICNTWGDAFYMIFDTVRDAGVFALRLQQALVPPPLGTANWAANGLPEDLSIRIALHAGPVFSFSDPVIRNISFTGRHVSFGARLEPATPPGQIYASEAFASLAIMHDVLDFRCDYMGVIRAAKDFGTVRAFRVCLANVSEISA